MSPDATAVHLAIGDFEHEAASTRRLLECLPDDRFDWRPHEKSWTLGELSSHLVHLLDWTRATIETERFDMAEQTEPPAQFTDTASLLAAWDADFAKVQEAIKGLSAEDLGVTWTLAQGDQTMMAMPRAAVLRGFCMSHIVHHRGQLTVYLRLLDVALPQVYGPTADDQSF
ncbi:MAG: DinB family protein [Acidobacteriota bacterium]